MKTALLVGDLFIPADVLRAGLEPLETKGYRLETRDLPVRDYDALQGLNRRVDEEGPAAFPLPDDLADALRAAELVVVHFCPLSAELLRSCPRLETIGTCRTGLSNIDTAAAADRGVPVIHCRGRLAQAVADFTVGLLLCEARNVARGHLALVRGEWRRDYANTGRIPELPGRTVGLVGFGAIGRAVARRLAGFDVRLLVTDPYADPAAVRAHGAEAVDLDRLLRESDFVSLHCPPTEETTGLLDARALALMKPDAYLVNTSRSPLVDEAALVEALREGRIAGAALDVFDDEPLPPGHPLLALDNVTLTPHMAGGSDDAFRRSPRLLCGLLLDHLDAG